MTAIDYVDPTQDAIPLDMPGYQSVTLIMQFQEKWVKMLMK